jgi:PTS system mannose-specific IIB component/fructoselysine and glucoselysine-specific PTS system IIB component
VTLELARIDDRLVHGQVVVGWGQPLDIEFLVLVDDAVASSDWEQELYRMGVPPSMSLYFHGTGDAIEAIPAYRSDRRRGILITGDIATMHALVRAGRVKHVNIGGIHHRDGRVQRLRYVFLTPGEEKELLALEADGAVVSARDVPSAPEIPLAEVLSGEHA